MFTHNLKIAFRNMQKYFNQTLISVIGLAVGFTCFALATLWLRYEMTFDSFHKNAELMYVVYSPTNSSHRSSGYNWLHRDRLASYLTETFPEIADAVTVLTSFPEDKVIVEGAVHPASTISADTSIFRMFDIKILEGSEEFLIAGSGKIAITQQKALKLFGNENPIGKTIYRVHDFINDFTICAIVSDIPKRSNFAFDFISPPFAAGGVTIIKLHSKTNIKSFQHKLYEHEIVEPRIAGKNLIIKPIVKIRYTDPDIRREIKFQYIVIFSVSGLLVILCALFNYLTLFVNRFRIRQKELALRVVCGASGRSLLSLLSVEFLLTLMFAVVLGCMLTQWLYKPFLTLSGIQMELSTIYLESLVYIGCIIIVSLSVFWLILIIFRHRSLNVSIRRGNRNMSRKISVVLQLVISTGFAFCAIVIMRQINYLHHTDDLGISFKNRASITIIEQSFSGGGVLASHLKQIPEIVEVVDADRMTDLVKSRFGPNNLTISSWDEKNIDSEEIAFEQYTVNPDYTRFYDFRLIAGEMLTDADPNNLVLLNESAVRAFGWHEPVGKQFQDSRENFYTVKGIVKNIYSASPTAEASPAIHNKGSNSPWLYRSPTGLTQFFRTVLFKYEEGLWMSCKEKIEETLKREFPDLLDYEIFNYEEEFKKILKSEGVLVRLLSFAAAICIVICVFGFVSLVSLTCEERRKSIAIRKINGATAGDILAMFAKEYFFLLIIGAAIAFPASYLIMQRWLEHYAIRTNISAWIYLTIMCVLALVIVLCVGWQVYRSSVENPAKVVKSE